MKPSKKESEYMAAVATLPCSVNNRDCGGRLEVHHKTGAGMAKRADHYDTMPLCFNHHSAQTPLKFGHSVHKGTRTFEATYGTQDEMIAKTKKLLAFDIQDSNLATTNN